MKNLLLLSFVLISGIISSQNLITDKIVDASCGQCQFNSDEQKGCDLAIKIDDKVYWVKNTGIDDHGDSHASNGFCNAVRKAKVSGIIKNDNLYASSFSLVNIKSPDNVGTSCELIEKSFINKGGKVTEYTELYLRCSVQDYFIKLCESEVTKEELKKYLDKGITVEMEIKDGMWDHCNDDPSYAQSRTGTYVIINKILK